MKILDLMREGKLDILKRKPDREVESVIAHIFFVDDDVYKIYKPEMISHTETKSFYEDDFNWNKSTAPDYFDELIEVEVEGEKYFVIKMKKYDESKILFDNLRDIKDWEFIKEIINSICDKKEELSERFKADLEDVCQMTLKENETYNVEGLLGWISHTDVYTKEEQKVISEKFFEKLKEEYFDTYKTEDYVVAMDSHTGNVLLEDKKVCFVDIMPPRREWRIKSRPAVLSRPIVDFKVLSGIDDEELMWEVYENRYEKLPQEVKDYYMLFAAVMQTVYLNDFGKKDLSEKFKEFSLKLLNK